MPKLKNYIDAIGQLNKTITSMGGIPTYDILYKYYSLANYIISEYPEERGRTFSLTLFVKEWCDRLMQHEDDAFVKLKWECLLFEARNMIVDSYLLYLEKNRDKSDRFYEPRRKCFLKIGLIEALQDVLDGKIKTLCLSMPPGTGKTTVEKFFLSGVCGWFPKEFNLFFSHSGDITRVFYTGMEDILTSNEYTWSEIFPDCKVTSTNAKLEQININKYKPFPNVQCTSVGAKNSGKVRASKFLMCDDLIGGIEEALNPNTLNKIWNIYSVDARQRKIDGCSEIIIATRWSVNDPIGRLQREYENDPRYRFIAIPDIDPITGESNFLFDIGGFTVEFFNDQARLMDDVSYRCLYKNDPIEREGLLYPEGSLRRYLNLPQKEPDEILLQCDPKGSGTDFMFAPCLLRYGEDYYCTECVCNKESDYEIQYQSLTNIIVMNRVQSAEFEANMGGDRVAIEVDKRVQQAGWICNITYVPTESNKEARIFQTANWVKQHILFKDSTLYDKKSDYGEMITQMQIYSIAGKNKNDDIPDGFANFALRVTSLVRVATIEAMLNPFWSHG